MQDTKTSEQGHNQKDQYGTRRDDENRYDLLTTLKHIGEFVQSPERPLGPGSRVEIGRIRVGRCPQGDAQVVAGMLANERVLPDQQANHHQGHQAAAHVHGSLIRPIPSTPSAGVGVDLLGP